MKKIHYIVSMLIVLLVILSSCEREKLDYGDRGDVGGGVSGQLNLSSLSVTLAEEATEVKSVTRAVSTDDFIIRIFKIASNGEDTQVNEWAYKDMPDVVTLSTGRYRLEAHSHDPLPMEWEHPYYYVDAEFDIQENTVTDLGELICTLHSVKVTVEYDAELQKYMGDDVTVNVKVGSGSADFTKDEARAVYFYTTDFPSVLVSEFVGTVAGEPIVLRQSFTDVEAGQHRKIIYSLKDTNLDGNQESGTITPVISLDGTCTVVEKNQSVTVDPEPVIPDENPDLEEPDPSGDAPVITGDGIGTPLTISKGGQSVPIAIAVSAPKGIRSMMVDIQSNTLTPEELEGVGLTDHLDLVNPGQYEESLRNMGFPVKDGVQNQTSVSFDITQFGPLLAILGPGTHTFVLTVVDNEGQETVENLVIITI